MCCEISVTVKDDEKSLKKKYLIYEPVTASEQDPIICKCIAETVANFAAEPTDVKVRIDLEL